MHKSKIDQCLAVIAITLIVVPAFGQSGNPDPRSCLTQGDPVAAEPFNLVDSFCVPPDMSIRAADGSATVESSGVFPANDAGQLDVFVIWEPQEIATVHDQSFTYSSNLSWSTANPDARFREWVGNFNPGPDKPFAVNITDTNDAALTPVEFSRTATSASVADRTFTTDQFPPPIGRYHIQITGLQPGELVTFSKSAAGGMVVPEPSSAIMGLLAMISLAGLRKRRIHTIV